MASRSLYRSLSRRNPGALSLGEQGLIKTYLMRPQPEGGGLTETEASEATAAITKLVAGRAAQGHDIEVTEIVDRLQQVAEIYRGSAAPAPVAPAAVAPPAPVAAPEAPQWTELTDKQGNVLVSAADHAFYQDYKQHWEEQARDARAANQYGGSDYWMPDTWPSSARVVAAVVRVMRVMRPNLSEITVWPSIVASPPRFLGAVSTRLGKHESQGQAFRLWVPQSTVNCQIAASWVSQYDNNWLSLARKAGYWTEGEAPDYDVGTFGRQIGFTSKGSQNLNKPSDRWSVEFDKLTADGKVLAKQDQYLSAYSQSGSGFKTEKGPVYLCCPIFSFKSEDPDMLKRRIAYKLEEAGLYALAAAIRIGFCGQYMEEERNEDLPFLAKAPRIQSKDVTDRQGNTILVEGLGRRNAAYQVIERSTPEMEQRALAVVPPLTATKTIPPRRIGDAPTVETWRLFPYQEVGVAFLALNKGRGLIGDEMGLGKTVQALAFLSLRRNPVDDAPTLPALVVCPASVVTNWKRECNTWLPDLKVWIYESGGNERSIPRHDVCIVSWDLMGIYPDRFADKGYQTLIADEAHYAKNLYKGNTQKPRLRISVGALMGREGDGKASVNSPYTRRTSGFLVVGDTIPHRILLTGTPMSNAKIGELWTLLRLLDRKRFPELKAFYGAYSPTGDEIERRRAEGENPYQEVEEVLNEYQCRRIKQVVADQTALGELRIPGQPVGFFGPTKRIQTNYVEPTAEQVAYIEAFQEGMVDLIRKAQFDQRMNIAIKSVLMGEDPYDVIERINEIELTPEATEAVALAVTNYERQFVGEMKVPNAICWIDQKVVSERKPVVVWAYHKNVVNAVAEVLKDRGVRFQIVNGGLTAQQKGDAVDAFQNADIDVIIGTTAMAEGVTLVRAHEALFIEPWWTPGKMVQAEDRIFRVGQKEDVVITYLRLPNVHTRELDYESIDERMFEAIDAKNTKIGSIVGIDAYTQEGEDTALCDAAKGAMQRVYERMLAMVEEGSLLPEQIDVNDLISAVDGTGKNQVTVYTLSTAYSDPEVLEYPVELLMDSGDAVDLLENSKAVLGKSISPTALRVEIIDYLADQPNQTASRADLVKHLAVVMAKAPSTSRLQENVETLKEAGILSGFKAAEHLPYTADKAQAIVATFQRAGGTLDANEAKKKMPNVPRRELNDLVILGVLNVSVGALVRANPRRRPGQMVHNGQLADLPLNPWEATDVPSWDPGTREANMAAQERERLRRDVLRRLQPAARRNPSQANLPSAGYEAYRLRAKLRGRRNPRQSDEVLDAYNALHAAVEKRMARGLKPQPRHIQLLQKAHAMLKGKT